MVQVSEEPQTEAQPDEYEFEFFDWPFYWLARSDRLYLSVLERALATIDLDIPSWRVLMVLHSKKKASVSELSEHSIVKLSTMTKIIQRMASSGLVVTAPNTIDRRVTMVTITAHGEIAGKDASHTANRIMTRVFANFTPDEVSGLSYLLKKLARELAVY